MADTNNTVYGGVDTHKDFHVVAAVDEVGRVVATATFSACAVGYRRLTRWLQEHGTVVRVGVEGTGSYGAGLARYLTTAGIEVVEVNRFNRQMRRRRGKSDTVDAEAAARAALNGEASGPPKSSDGIVEAIRMTRIVFSSMRNTRTRVANQIRDLIITAPDVIRAELGSLDTEARVEICARFRPGPDPTDPLTAAKAALRALARHHQALSVDIDDLRARLDQLTIEANPSLRDAVGVGADVASILLIAAGDNADRLTSDAAFAAICGVSPIEASSGQHVAHRLNRGGNRDANHALWRIATVRMSCHQPTKDYVARRQRQGKSHRFIIRCLKRYIAREIYLLLVHPRPATTRDNLRPARLAAGITLTTAGQALQTHHSRLSELERGTLHRPELEHRYRTWLAEQAS